MDSWRGRLLFLILAGALAALLTVVTFDTRDHRGTRRPRTAVQTWQAVPGRLAATTGWPGAPSLFKAAATATLLGTLLLLWYSTSDRSGTPNGDEEEEGGLTIVRAAREAGAILRSPDNSLIGSRTIAGLLFGLAAFAAWKLGAFTSHGAVAGLPDTFASMDHPFHLARAEELRRSLAGGESLRWIANHQGGYPAEFYPFGFAYFEVALWALAGGAATMASVHTVAVILVFLAPLPIYWGLARRDRWPPVVALAAGVVHVAIPGGIWHGGYSELVQMGLVSNVTSATLVYAAFLALLVVVERGSRVAVGLAAIASGAALWANPRSGLGLAMCAGAVWATGLDRTELRRSGLHAARRIGAVAVLAGLLAAPELLSLIRFGDLYYFVRLTSYADSMDYLRASMEAVSLPVFLCAVAGCLTAWLMPREKRATRASVLALALYVLATTVLSFDPRAGRAVQQLETTRLMPLQRLLTIYLAAVGLHVVCRLAAAAAGRWRLRVTDGLQLAAVAVVVIVYLGPLGLMPANAAGLYPTDRSSTPETAALQLQLAIAQREAAPGQAILVVGSLVSAHQQLLAPLVADRPYFYDNWLWTWHTQHVGPYDPRHAAWYAPKRLATVFAPEYLETHGIGAVVVGTDRAQRAASASATLEQLTAGVYAVYTVKDRTSIVTLGDAPPGSFRIANHVMTAEGQHPGGAIVIRRNWHPRWQAEVNGQRVPIAHRPDGYMALEAPAGHVSLTLRYALDRWDWAGRYAAVAGLLLAGYTLLAVRLGRLVHVRRTIRRTAQDPTTG